MRVHNIGGRFFEESSAATRSSRHDGWIMVVLEDAKILGATLKGISELANEDAARKLVIETMRSGKFHHIVAGLLVEMDKKWSIDSAEANAEWFAELTAPEDKAAILSAFTEALLNFFLNGAPSSTPSPIVSAEKVAIRRPNRARGKPSTATPADSGPMPPVGSQTATATA
jgi:hypothetical protein